MPSVVDARGTSAHLILNPAAGNAALLGSMTRAAHERGIRVRVLEPGEDARLAALEAADDGAAKVYRREPHRADVLAQHGLLPLISDTTPALPLVGASSFLSLSGRRDGGTVYGTCL